jgi:hypothetical protein
MLNKSYFRRPNAVMMLANGRVHIFVMSDTETAWIHREQGEFDFAGAYQISREEYIEQVRVFIEKIDGLRAMLV